MRSYEDGKRVFNVGNCGLNLLSLETRIGYNSCVLGWDFDIFEFPTTCWELASGYRCKGEAFPFCEALRKADNLLFNLESNGADYGKLKRKARRFWETCSKYIRRLDEARDNARESTPHRWRKETEKARQELEKEFLEKLEKEGL